MVNRRGSEAVYARAVDCVPRWHKAEKVGGGADIKQKGVPYHSTGKIHPDGYFLLRAHSSRVSLT